MGYVLGMVLGVDRCLEVRSCNANTCHYSVLTVTAYYDFKLQPQCKSSHVHTCSIKLSLMSIGTYSLASGRDPESSYANSSTYEINDRSTPIPGLQESSHDEYTPTRVSTRESASIIFTTPTHRSASAGLSSKTRKALEKLYDRNYGARHCLVTSSAAYLVTVAHAVQRASKSDLVGNFITYEMFNVNNFVS